MPTPSRQHVLDQIDRERLEQTLIEMIDIYSPSLGEHELLAYLRQWLERHQLDYSTQPVSDGVYNILLTLGDGEPGLYLLGHIDTIPHGHRQDHQATRVDGHIEGLGAADMKGGCAAMLEAFLALKKAGYPADAPPVGLALLVDEETEGTGSATWLKSHRPDLAVIGEPTDLRLCNEHYGYCELYLHAKGKRVHSAIPELGHNAIIDMMQLLHKIYELPQPPGPQRWYHPNLRSLQGDNADFTVPDQCEAYLDIHLSPTTSPTAYIEKVDALIYEHTQSEQLSAIQHRWEMQFPGYHLDESASINQLTRRAMETIDLPVEQGAFRSHSDANILAQYGIETIVIGPGALETAHTAEETIATHELHQAARLYAALILEYAKS